MEAIVKSVSFDEDGQSTLKFIVSADQKEEAKKVVDLTNKVIRLKVEDIV